MSDFLKCPGCGEKVAIDRADPNRPSQCDRCGSFVSSGSADWNPYDPPSSSLGQGEGVEPVPIEIPPTVVGKFLLAFQLVGSHFGLYALIILSVWLPANVIVASLVAGAKPGQEASTSTWLNFFFQTVFGPVTLGALIFSVSKWMKGEKVGYFEAMAVSFSKWPRYFFANFIAGLTLMLGFIALIIPGILLWIRYAFLGAAAILETGNSPPQRSWSLTSGWGLRIFSSALVFFTPLIVFAVAVVLGLSILQEEAEWLNNPWVDGAVSCLTDLLRYIFTVILVLFYLDARSHEVKVIKEVSPDDEFQFGTRMSQVG
jgi:hypothetical protein